jgi:hypothetical protein
MLTICVDCASWDEDNLAFFGNGFACRGKIYCNVHQHLTTIQSWFINVLTGLWFGYFLGSLA